MINVISWESMDAQNAYQYTNPNVPCINRSVMIFGTLIALSCIGGSVAILVNWYAEPQFKDITPKCDPEPGDIGGSSNSKNKKINSGEISADGEWDDEDDDMLDDDNDMDDNDDDGDNNNNRNKNNNKNSRRSSSSSSSIISSTTSTSEPSSSSTAPSSSSTASSSISTTTTSSSIISSTTSTPEPSSISTTTSIPKTSTPNPSSITPVPSSDAIITTSKENVQNTTVVSVEDSNTLFLWIFIVIGVILVVVCCCGFLTLRGIDRRPDHIHKNLNSWKMLTPVEQSGSNAYRDGRGVELGTYHKS